MRKLRSDIKVLTGIKFGRLLVIGFDRIGKKLKHKCQCDCGKITYVEAWSLKRNKIMSCGCYKLDKQKECIGDKNPSFKHGNTVNNTIPKVYRAWASMLTRCTNKKNKAYKHYGERGISVCAEWFNFEIFLRDVGHPPSGDRIWSIGRIDNNGNYEPNNVRWETMKQQTSNRRTNVWLEHGGKRMLISDWDKYNGWPSDSIGRRLRHGWSVADAITRPRQIKGSCHKATLKENIIAPNPS